MAATANEMAELAFDLLTELDYEPTHKGFDRTLFITVNNDAFLQVFQFLLKRFDDVEYKRRFKYCLPVDDKRKEATFRKEVCSYLTQLQGDGILEDAPAIKMALFQSPGRTAFLQLLMSILHMVMVARQDDLGLVMPSPTATADEIEMARKHYEDLYTATKKRSAELDERMKENLQVACDMLVKAEERYAETMEKVDKMQEEELILPEDRENLEKLGVALSDLMSVSGRIQRVSYLADMDKTVLDATSLYTPLNDCVLGKYPDLAKLSDEVAEGVAECRVDVTKQVQLIKSFVSAMTPSFNSAMSKLTQTDSLNELISEERNSRQKPEPDLAEMEDTLEDVVKEIVELLPVSLVVLKTEENEHQFIDMSPPTSEEIQEIEAICAPLDALIIGGEDEGDFVSMAPPKNIIAAPSGIRKRQLRLPNIQKDTSAFLTPSLSKMATPHLKDERKVSHARRSIREFTTSTPFGKS